MTGSRERRQRRASPFVVATLAVCCVAALSAPPAFAQPTAGWTFEPTLSLSGEYDSNIDGSASDPQSDYIGRLTPGLGLTYVGPQLSLFARYSFDAEVYAERTELNNVGDRQRASVGGTYVVDPLTTVGLGLNFTRTANSADFLRASPAPPPPVADQPPAEAAPTPPIVLPPVGVDAGRRDTWVLTVSPYISRQFTPATSGTAGYSYTHTEVSGDPGQSEHLVSLFADHTFTALHRGRLRYTFRAFQSEDVDTETSHSVLLGYGRQLTPRTSFQIEAGPHFQESDVNLEANAQLSHNFQRGSTGLSYSRAQTLVVGEVGAPIVDTVTAYVSYVLLRDLNVGLSGSFSNIAEDGQPDTQTYGITATAYYAITTWAAAFLTYQYTLGDPGSDRVERHVVTLGLTFAYPIRLR